MSDAYLTMSRFMAGQQCDLRLWNQCFEPLPFEAAEPCSLRAMARQVKEAARNLFPGGQLVDGNPWDHPGAVRRTSDLVSAGCPAIFDAAIEHGPLHARIDILENKGPKGWALHKVKSSTAFKEEHYDEMAFQVEVLNRASIPLESIHVIHVNGKYQRGYEGIDWQKFFSRHLVTDVIQTRTAEISSHIAPMLSLLKPGSPPNIAPGRQCKHPRECEFFEQCGKLLPNDWIGKLPNINAPLFEKLQSQGIDAISKIPQSVPLSAQQQTIRQVHHTGHNHVSSQAGSKLKLFGPPAVYLDFECFIPTIPLYAETCPYQHIPFLWSLHRVDRDSNLSHTDFIAEPSADPRRPFIDNLLAKLAGSNEPIVVYSGYEKRILEELKRTFPNLSAKITRVVNRLQDLLPYVKKNIYLPEFNGSFSIKHVAPALDQNVTYSDLAITNGTAASTAYQQLVEGNTAGKDPTTVLQNLRDYCERDTEAMVKVHQALQRLLK